MVKQKSSGNPGNNRKKDSHCMSCNDTGNPGDKWLDCDSCALWYHLKCQNTNMSDDFYASYVKFSSKLADAPENLRKKIFLFYLCDNCDKLKQIKIEDKGIDMLNNKIQQIDVQIKELGKIKDELKCEISDLKQSVSTASILSYSDVLKSSPDTNRPPDFVQRNALPLPTAEVFYPRMKVTPLTNQSAKVTRKDIQNVILSNANEQLQVNSVKELDDGSVRVECKNLSICTKLNECIDLNKYKVDMPKMLKPRVKVVNIDYLNLDVDLVKTIVDLNGLNPEKCSVELLKKYQNARTNTWTLVLELDPVTFKMFLRSGYVYICDQRCKVYEHIGLRQCGNCLELTHGTAFCNKGKKCCLKCGSDTHNVKDCPAEVARCVNCHEKNLKFKADLDDKHFSTSNDCPSKILVANNIRRRVLQC